MGYEILKDLRDLPGDPPPGPRPAPLQRNPGAWRRTSSILIVAGSLLLILPAFLGCRWPYIAIASLAMTAAWLSPVLPVRRAINVVYAECMLVGVAALVDVVAMG